MNIESLRVYCLSFPGATEQIQWGNDLLFKVGGKIFVSIGLGGLGGPTFKCTPETFAELTSRDGIRPADYVGRYNFVSLEAMNTVKDTELRELIAQSYQLVVDKLPRKDRPSASGTGAQSGSEVRGPGSGKSKSDNAPRKTTGNRK